MAARHARAAGRLMISPAVVLLLGWMLVPLGLTLYFSFLRYNLLMPGMEQWTGWTNYYFFLTDPSFWDAIRNTLTLVVGVLVITIIGGVLLALLLDSGDLGAKHRAPSRHRAILRDAHGFGAGPGRTCS